MDEFSWGNTRLVVGEGKEKKVLMNEDEKFDESMIPLKKFSGASHVHLFPKNLDLIDHLRVRSGGLGDWDASFRRNGV